MVYDQVGKKGRLNKEFWIKTETAVSYMYICMYLYIYIYINNCPRCNTKQSIYYFASSPYMFRMSTTPIIRSTQNCKYSLRYWSCVCAAISLQCGPWPLTALEGSSCTKDRPVPEAVVTVLCTPDDGCG